MALELSVEVYTGGQISLTACRNFSGTYCLRDGLVDDLSHVLLALENILQLDWPWIAERAYAGIFAVAVQFQNQDKFWISRQKNQRSFFSKNIKN